MTDSIQPPQQLAKFSSKHLKYVRVVEKKHGAGKGKAKRVLALNMTALLLTSKSGDSVLRFVRFDKVREVVTQEDPDGVPQVLIKTAHPEHDILVYLTHDPINTSPSTMDEAEHLASVIQKNAKRCLKLDIPTSSPPGRGQLRHMANLQKSRDFVRPADVLARARRDGSPLVTMPPRAPPQDNDAARKQKEHRERVAKEDADRRERDEAREKDWSQKMELFEHREKELKEKERALDRLATEQRHADAYVGSVGADHDTDGGASSAFDDGVSSAASSHPSGSFMPAARPVCSCDAAAPRPFSKSQRQSDPLDPHELDYWTRFVLRWEAEGLSHAENL
eukprot:TRINITY_DN28717_c0_g1_i1.p1 TRINITY_DN28717_c0_g1~~TRINITY_DN28717_c0_g1_i1.p1  ORF type:complete len:336 (+),score=110.34 TRINITY_DN28717_c0_g1_i1:105-1112(+)